MEHGAPLQRRTTLSSCSRSAASVRRAGPMCPAAAHAFSAGHAGPALQGTGRVRADRVVRPYSGSRSRAKRDVVPQGHLFRCAPLRDAVPYERFAVPIRRAGPMCPAARYARFPSGGARGPRPTECSDHAAARAYFVYAKPVQRCIDGKGGALLCL